MVGCIFAVACSTIKSIGRFPSKEQQAEFAQLPNYRNGTFQNLYRYVDTTLQIPQPPPRGRFNKERYSRFKKPILSCEMPSVKTNLKDTSFQAPTIVWFGHSSYLIQSKGFNILVDPVFSGYGSPIWFVNRNYKGSNIYGIKDLPTIDLLILTHDHYDHMDYKTVKKLRKSVGYAIVPLGLGRTLNYWGYKDTQFCEMYWADSVTIAPDILLIATPAQHFSGRRNKGRRTLWTSYVLEIHGYRIFLSGDGGYSQHFKEIGDQYGPFDLALLENGQYSAYWQTNHCFPEQTARAARDLQSKMIFPIHWAKFSATYHPWNEPVERLLPKADSLGIPVTIPKIGEPYTIGDTPKREIWWDFD